MRGECDQYSVSAAQNKLLAPPDLKPNQHLPKEFVEAPTNFISLHCSASFVKAQIFLSLLAAPKIWLQSITFVAQIEHWWAALLFDQTRAGRGQGEGALCDACGCGCGVGWSNGRGRDEEEEGGEGAGGGDHFLMIDGGDAGVREEMVYERGEGRSSSNFWVTGSLGDVLPAFSN
ncbi:hypothetical protein BDK51DRAFT_26815 [Blyttiomyces helicus]|uniref:Uncharacterized protein n=1 Tax=Blyttiomyces helicus TaxID=388810 RepID=A0A4P9W8C1_9FUNG|nr:hypothetical protein BDK51DRAFT_26815 [Blyttiomyces helicus]|eukprot:RKO87318.1 hypothetical protein BDK51DRAFT_26815 [Blyttiomyces helicus]